MKHECTADVFAHVGPRACLACLPKGSAAPELRIRAGVIVGTGAATIRDATDGDAVGGVSARMFKGYQG